jgi:hypothetical protein
MAIKKDQKIFQLYLNEKEQNRQLRTHLNRHLTDKVKNHWGDVEKKLINGHWWVKSTDALK